MTTTEAAKTLNVRIEEVYRLLAMGRIGAYKVGGRWDIDAASVRSYRERHKPRKRAVAAQPQGVAHA